MQPARSGRDKLCREIHANPIGSRLGLYRHELRGARPNCNRAGRVNREGGGRGDGEAKAGRPAIPARLRFQLQDGGAERPEGMPEDRWKRSLLQGLLGQLLARLRVRTLRALMPFSQCVTGQCVGEAGRLADHGKEWWTH